MALDNQPASWVDGIRLFNDGDYFACHEAFEELWYSIPEGQPLPDAGSNAPSQKKFVQGVLQFAVTLVHVRRGNPRGVRVVYKNAMEKLHDAPDAAMGIDVRALKSEMKRVIDPILALPEKRFAPGRPRDDDLPWDDTRPPRITTV